MPKVTFDRRKADGVAMMPRAPIGADTKPR